MNLIFGTFHHASPMGFSYEWRTSRGGQIPMHWHQELELLYLLNGEADLTVRGKTTKMKKRHLIIVEERQIHGIHCKDDSTMFLIIHIAKEALQAYVPQIELSSFELGEENISDELFPKYVAICQSLEDLTRRYMMADETFRLEADGIIMQVMAALLRDFSKSSVPVSAGTDMAAAERICSVIDFVQNNFEKTISLADGAEVIGVGREAFSRFFKKMMGSSFLQYVNEVRLSHSYEDLMQTDLPIREIMERNGLTNQKLYNRLFKEYYGMTPSEARKHPELQDRMAEMFGIRMP